MNFVECVNMSELDLRLSVNGFGDHDGECSVRIDVERAGLEVHQKEDEFDGSRRRGRRARG